MHEERLRAVLPFLRPRTEEPTGFVLLLFIVLCLGLLALVGLYIWRKRSVRLKQEARFGKLAREKGLVKMQSDYLIQLARQHRMNNSLLLLNSAYAFDRVAGLRAAELVDTPNEAELETIGAIRAALGFDRLPPDQPLRTTRQFETGITVMVWHEGGEAFFPWVLVGRDERGLTVVPLFREDYARFADLGRGDALAARIWREADTEYRFYCEILEVDPESLVATLRHDDAIERLQQRDYYRLDVQFDITFAVVALAAEERTDEGEAEDGDRAGRQLTGQVLNLSAGGLSALVDEPVPPGWLLRVDPSCNRPFPLGGLFCQVMGTDASTNLQVRFDELDPERERELVRHIYQHQTGGAESPTDADP